MTSADGRISTRFASDSGLVLLTSNDASWIEAILAALEGGEFTVQAVPDAESALELTRHVIPDVIISDGAQPGAGGAEFCRRLKANRSTVDTPVLMVTASLPDERSLIEAFDAGAEDYLEIDSSRVLLRKKAQKLIARHRARRERKHAEEALRESEERYRTLAETASDAIITTDGESTILFVNRAAEKIFGYTTEEMLGQKLTMLMPEYLRHVHMASVNRYLHSGKHNIPWEGVEFLGLHKSGKEVPLEISFGEFSKNGKRFFAGIARDITERMRAEQVQAATYRISEAANSASDLQSLFRLIHQIVGELMPVENFFIALYDSASEELSFPYFVDARERPPAQRRLGRGATEYVLRTGALLHAPPEVFRELIRTGEAELIGPPSIDWLGVPLKTKEKTIGVLAVQSYTEAMTFGEEEKDILVFVSTQVAMAIEQKRVEQALRESEKRFRALIEKSSDAIALVDQNGTIVYAGPSTGRVLGYSNEEFVGRNAFEFIHPDDHEYAMNLLAELVEKHEETVSAQYRLLHKDGSWRWMEGLGRNLLAEPGVQAIVHNYRDITDRKRAEEALRESETQFRSITEIAACAIMIYQGPRFKYVNPATEQITGYSRQELLSMDFWDVVHPDFRELVKERGLARQRGDRVPSRYEFKIVTKDAEERWIDATAGQIDFAGGLAALSTAYDVTERKHAEEALRQAEAKYRGIFENSVEGIFQSTREGQFITANPALARMLGYGSPEELVSTVTDIGTQLYVDHERRFEVLRLLESKGVVRREKHELRRKDGNKVWVSLNARAIHDSRGSVLYYEGTVVDITERMQAEQELKDSREQLRALSAHLQLAREEESTRMAREIHDVVGQALTGLKLDLFWLGDSLSEDRKTLLGRVESMSELIDTTIHAVHRLSADLRPPILDDFGVTAAIEWQVKEFQNRTGIKCSFRSTPKEIVLDQARSTAVFRILQEALTNIARHANASKVKIYMKEKTGGLVLEVRDDGKGITEARVSDPKSLGIVGMRERAYALGGHLTISSDRDKGAKLIVQIPLDE